MINLLLGAPGGGKSYEATVYHILPALQQGRKVVTNLPLNVEAFCAIDPAFGPLIEVRTATKAKYARDGAKPRPFSVVEDYADDWRHPEKGFGPLFVIDECHLALPKGETDRAVEEWYSMHRHHNVDGLLITQSYGKISAAVRDLVQVVYRVRKNVALGSTGSYTRKVQDGLRGEVVNTTIRKYEKRYFSLYRSHTQGKAVDEFNASDVRPIWKHWSFQGAAVCVAVLVYMLASGKVSAPWSVPERDAAKKVPASAPMPPGSAASASSNPQVSLGQENASQPSPADQAEAEAKREPFGERGVHLTGYLEMPGRRVWTFVLSQNGQRLGSISQRELIDAGYRWEGHSHCSGVLRWGEKVERNVICDSPQVGVFKSS